MCLGVRFELGLDARELRRLISGGGGFRGGRGGVGGGGGADVVRGAVFAGAGAFRGDGLDRLQFGAGGGLCVVGGGALRATDVPPGRMCPEKAALSDFCSVWYLEMLTEEIENSTMNSAISSVIMSA